MADPEQKRETKAFRALHAPAYIDLLRGVACTKKKRTLPYRNTKKNTSSIFFGDASFLIVSILAFLNGICAGDKTISPGQTSSQVVFLTKTADVEALDK